MSISRHCWSVCEDKLHWVDTKVYFNGSLHKFVFICYSANRTLVHVYGPYNLVELLTNNTMKIQALQASIRYLALGRGDLAS